MEARLREQGRTQFRFRPTDPINGYYSDPATEYEFDEAKPKLDEIAGHLSTFIFERPEFRAGEEVQVAIATAGDSMILATNKNSVNVKLGAEIQDGRRHPR